MKKMFLTKDMSFGCLSKSEKDSLIRELEYALLCALRDVHEDKRLFDLALSSIRLGKDGAQ